MVEQPSPPRDEKQPEIRRGRVDSVNLYEVKEEELEVLEKGSHGSVQLNFAIFLLSTAFTSIAALLTSEFKGQTTKTIFIVCAIVGIVLGVYFVIVSMRSRKTIGDMVSKIKDRITHEPISAQDGTELRPK